MIELTALLAIVCIILFIGCWNQGKANVKLAKENLALRECCQDLYQIYEKQRRQINRMKNGEWWRYK